MSAIEPLLRQPAAQAIGWALLQFIWQGALIGLLTAWILAALRRSAADVRYVVATIGLSLMLTMPIVTALQAWRATQAAVSPSEAAIKPTASASAVVGPEASRQRQQVRVGKASLPQGGLLSAAVRAVGADTPPSIARGPSDRWPTERFELWLAAVLAVWLSGVSILSLRLMSGWLWVQRMKSHRAKNAADEWQRIAAKLSRRLHIARAVRLMESAAVEVPTVIGWLKPVVLLPASALAGLAPAQLEAILAHELAHIRRHDYIVNLVQTLVETLLFYHPAVWWVSRRIRIERENCCDDLAVSLCGDPYTYARALADLEELRGNAGRLALAVTGGSLLQRIRRLLGAPSHAGRGPAWLAGTSALLLLAGMAAGAIGQHAFGSEPASTSLASTVPEIQASTPPQFAQTSTAPKAATTAAAKEAEARARELARAQDELRALLADQARTLEENAAAIAASTSQEHAAVAEAEAMHRAATAATLAGADLPEDPALAPAFAGLKQSHGNFTWSNGREKLEISYSGEIEFTDDDTDVRRISPGGWLKIRDGGWVGGRTIEFRADAAGNIQRRFWVGTSEKPFEPEGRQWLAQALPRFIRQTGIGASARVARILKAKGVAGVLAEISLIEGSWAKRIYFSELLTTGKLDSQTIRQALGQAGREVDSDFELASLLIGATDLLVDDGARQAYFEAARSIGSDFEMHRVFSAALKRGTVSPAILANVLEASTAIDSDFEEASLLIEVAKLQPLDTTTRSPFFKALGTVGSDFEHRRVLSALARADLAPETVSGMVDSATTIGSDFEQATFLVDIVKLYPIEGGLRAPFFRVVQSIDSAFERGRVLQAVVKRGDSSDETIVAVLGAVKDMKGSFEAAQVLMAVAAQRPLTGEARGLYIDAAEQLGDFEQGRALAALVKNERRK